MQSGALAQLGARNIRIVEAVGSNPICSIFYQQRTGLPVHTDPGSLTIKRDDLKESVLSAKPGFFVGSSLFFLRIIGNLPSSV